MRRRTVLTSLGLALTGAAGCSSQQSQPEADPTDSDGGGQSGSGSTSGGTTPGSTPTATATPLPSVDPSAFSLTEAWQWTPPESGQTRQTTGVTVGEGYLTLARAGADSTVTAVIDGASGTERWRRQLDLGLPTVHGPERLYHAAADDGLAVAAVDAASGEQAWRYSPDVEVPADGVGPTVQLRAGDAGIVAALDTGAATARPGQLALVDRATGETAWEITDIGDLLGLTVRGDSLLYAPVGGPTTLVDLAAQTARWQQDLPGTSQPALTRELAVIPAETTPDQRDGATIAYDRASGEEVWRSAALSPVQAASITVTDRAVVRTTTATGRVTIHGHGLDAGEQAWEQTFETEGVEALAAPVQQFDGRALVVPLSDGRLVLCSLSTGEPVAETTVEAIGRVRTDSERVYVVSEDSVRAVAP